MAGARWSGGVRRHDGGGPRARCRVSPAGHPGQQRRRSAAGRFPQLGSRRLARARSTPTCSADRADQATLDGMIARNFGRVVNITSATVKAPIDVLGLSNGARAGLTGFIAGLSRKVAAHGVTINNLLPGQFDTDRLRSTREVRRRKPAAPVDMPRARARQIPARRFGTPGGIRRRLRVPVQRTRGLHHRPEHPARRRRLSRHLLTRLSGDSATRFRAWPISCR